MEALTGLKAFLVNDLVYAVLALAVVAVVMLYRQVQALQEKRIELAREVISLSADLVRVLDDIQKRQK